MVFAFAMMPSASIASIDATIEAIASGCPEYVSPPGNTWSSNAFAIDSLITTPPAGT